MDRVHLGLQRDGDKVDLYRLFRIRHDDNEACSSRGKKDTMGITNILCNSYLLATP